ncbi:MAG: hypothetical protein NC418_07290 [Muribaculaceae bacterium]|nr:hypothetical protein [Muribaculaceae bacterium]
MKLKSISLCASSALLLAGAFTLGSCTGKTTDRAADTKQETTAATPTATATADSALQSLTASVLPKFEQLTYTDATSGKTLKYSLLSPADVKAGESYPLVLFTADSRTGTQDYGALVWGSDSWQKENPCYVLVPELGRDAIDKDFKPSTEVDAAIGLLNSIVKSKQVDTKRIYAAGRSDGSMVSMYYAVAYPDLFAASIFVDSQLDNATLPQLVKGKFIYFVDSDCKNATERIKAVEKAAEAASVQYTWSEWSAQLPVERQSELAATMLGKGAPVNIFQFEADGKCGKDVAGNNAYAITAARTWLFEQSK